MVSFMKGANPPASSSMNLPTYKLESNTILLPGIIYKLSFTRFKAATLLSRFRIKNSSIITKLTEEFALDEESVPKISDRSLQGIKQFQSQLETVTKEAYDQELDLLILACIPNISSTAGESSSTNVVTVCRIIGIADESSGIKISLQALTRGQITDTTNYNKRQLSESVIKIDWNSNIEGTKTHLDTILEKSTNLFNSIDTFLKDYQIALSSKANDISGFKLLTLNPLANVLYLQLISKDFQKAYLSLKKLYSNTQSNIESKAILRLLDLSAAVLPVPVKERLEMLKQHTPIERISKMNEIFEFLNKTFLNLTDSCSYVDEFFTNSTDVQKASIVATQLKSIRLLLDAMGNNRKPSNQLTRRNLSKLPQRKLGTPNFGGPNDDDDDEEDELSLITKFVENINNITSIQSDSKRMIIKDYKRLKSTQQQNSDYQVIRNYLDIIIDIPWDQHVSLYKKDFEIDIKKAKNQLDTDHYGLNNVKKRLVQYLAVLKLISSQHEKIQSSLNNNEKIDSKEFTNDENDEIIFSTGNNKNDSFEEEKLSKSNKNQIVSKKESSAATIINTRAPIILLGGPPGVGKTSLAKSIAKSLGRNFQRISLGGIRDEAEIRGHRRTYVGAMPGVIIQSLRKARSMNPVILLDEIDKVIGGADGSSKVNGDPAAALLEVLDPEQNNTFIDHYIGFPVDLSQVMFICTANDIHNLSRPLLDRLELIEISAYDYNEKIVIGQNYLLPRQIKRNGLEDDKIIIEKDVLRKIVIDYTRESGVRNLERTLGTICRNKAVEYSSSLTNSAEKYEPKVSINDLPRFLGIPHSPSRELYQPFNSNKYGVVNGLSYNSDGSGSVLVFESIGFTGKNSLSMTGRLGEVLTESANIGLKFIRFILDRSYLSHCSKIDMIERFNNLEIHLHVPAGGISKDGPSAGITMALSFLSLILEKPVSSKIAMTGEITLRGSVLPIGGVKEKLLGAHLSGMEKVIVPRDNRKDIINEYCRGVNDDSELNALLIDDNKKHFTRDEPEMYIKEKLGIDLVYAEEFWDVIKAVWGDGLLNKFEQARLESHL